MIIAGFPVEIRGEPHVRGLEAGLSRLQVPLVETGVADSNVHNCGAAWGPQIMTAAPFIDPCQSADVEVRRGLDRPICSVLKGVIPIPASEKAATVRDVVVVAVYDRVDIPVLAQAAGHQIV